MPTSGTMLAAVLHAPYELEMEQAPIPTLAADEVLIEVLACGICTTDVELYDGSQPYLHNGTSAYPMIMGHEWCGQIAAMGDAVQGFTAGQLVVGDVSVGCGVCYNCMQGKYHLCEHRREVGVIHYDGAFAQYLKLPFKSVYAVAPGVSPRTAMFIEPAATSVRAVMKTGVGFGDRVLVYGDGSIGLFAAQAALAAGASHVAVAARKNLHKALIESWGMEFINTGETSVETGVQAYWGVNRAEVVFECTGNVEVCNEAIHRTASGGKLCAISFSGKMASLDIDDLVCRDITMVGTVASPNAFVPTMRMMQAGRIHVDGMLTAVYPLERAPEAFQFVKQKKGPRIKVGILKNLAVK
ncbi:MAG: alcohol dehydrogenase catalytic domain-containing protein [Oscillospiraceae bacterium]|nr:alcohol dehydrogenase catalytic domain-containing protein [Oscillospiraceae bacterium]